jgi:hypothetical protein
MKKILLIATILAFSTSAFAGEKPKQKAKEPYKPKTEFSKCDPVNHPELCKSKVHKKAQKKSASSEALKKECDANPKLDKCKKKKK